jgi:transglutaminase-like putative cysteine protease/outer membrane protein assembly factor BamB
MESNINKIMKRTLYVLGILVVLLSTTTAQTGAIKNHYPTPGNYPTGLTFDGKHLWTADRQTDQLTALNPHTGAVIRSLPSPGYWPMGMAWDGKFLWNADIKGGIPKAEHYEGIIYQIDPTDGTILHAIPAPTKRPHGLAWDGNYLWCADDAGNRLVQLDPNDGTTIRSIPAPATHPHGLTFDGQYLWVTDRLHDEIYMVSPEDGTVIINTKAPGPYVRDLAWDGENLWAVDSEKDLVFSLKTRDGQKYQLTDKRTATITYTYQITNFGPGKVKTADIHLAIPQNRITQKIIGEISYDPTYDEIQTDSWNQATAHYHFKNLKPGHSRTIHMTTKAEIWQVNYFIYPDKVGPMEEIPENIKTQYLKNNNKYRITHPLIQQTVKKVVNDIDNPYWTARKLYHYLTENMYYEMVGGWNTAPAVLARGNGSCSEYAFVYIALCRAAGIPARYVGSVVVRGENASMDDVFHRWVEIYLPRYGWIMVDPSGGDQPSLREQSRYFGQLANRFLITTQSGGGSETMEWTYNSNEFIVTDPKTHVVIEYYADWDKLNP